MKKSIYIGAMVVGMMAAACQQQQKTPTGSFATSVPEGQTAEAVEASEAETTVELTDTTMTYGSHRYTMTGNLTAEQYNREAWGRVTFTNVPTDYEEFERVYSEFLGKTPHGTAAMMPMAMAMYGRDRDLGERCIRLINYDSNVSSVLSQLRQKFTPSKHAPANDTYIQPYLPAAVLKGATPENGYTPSEPYTVEMTASINQHSDLKISGKGRVVYLYILGDGWDTKKRQVEVLQPGNNALHKVFNCPSLYTQCKTIDGEWKGLR